MGLNRSVACGSDEADAVREVNMCAILLEVRLRKSEVDEIDLVFELVATDHEIIGLDIAMYVALCVQILQTRQHLVCDHQHSLKRKLAATQLEEFLERLVEQCCDHRVNALALDIVVHPRETLLRLQVIQNLCLSR